MIVVVNFDFKIPDDAEVINSTSSSKNYGRHLSPFYLGPVKLYGNYSSINVENGWQYSKVYSEYIEDGNPTIEYFRWAEKGWNSKTAHRYPMGRDRVPEYCFWDGEKLSYIEARKNIYIPLYVNAVRNTSAFSILRDKYEYCLSNNKKLYIQAYDSYNVESPDYSKLLDNPNIKFGHGYVLAMILENKL